MKSPVKFVLFLLIPVTVIVVALLVLTQIYSKSVADIFIEEVNKRSDITLSISDSRLALLKRFPRASFQLKDLVVRGPDQIDGNDTIAQISLLSLETSLTNLLNKQYIIEWIRINNSSIRIDTDSSGNSNIDFLFRGRSSNRTSNVTIDLRNIRVSNCLVITSNSLKETESSTLLRSARLSGAITGSNALLRADGSLVINRLRSRALSIRQPVDASLRLELDKSDSLIVVKRGELMLEKMAFSLTGNYSLITAMTNIDASSQDADISSLSGFLPDRLGTWLRYKPSGRISASCKAGGILSTDEKLHFEVSFSLHNAGIELPGSGVRFSQSSLTGFFSNGAFNDATSSELVLNDIDVKTDHSGISGRLSFVNFLTPSFSAHINSSLDLNEISSLLKGTAPLKASGLVRASFVMSGAIPRKDEPLLHSIAGLNPGANLHFTSVSLNAGNFSLDDINGNIMIANHLWADSISLNINRQRIIADGMITDFVKWVRGEADIVEIRGYIASPLFLPGLLITTGASAGLSGTATLKLPLGYRADISFSADEFRHHGFSASEVSGHMNYQDGHIFVDRVSMNSMGGELSGSFRAQQNSTKGFSTEGSIQFSNIDINNAFNSFNNFSQDFILAGNLRGSISGKYDMRMDFDSLLTPDFYSISSEGRFIIDNGALVKFGPVMKMSRFVEISELEDIRFSRLENEFFINSGTFAIPHMEIRSSAADLGISGKHSFNGDYEYHLRVLLSQVLSGKAPKKTAANEFGIVEDDGLGRTSLFLVIRSAGKEETIGWDASAVRNEIRKDLQHEKQSLKSLLKEEYGWYSKDSTLLPAKEEKPKFRIIWDEGKNPGTVQQDTTEKIKQDNALKKLINKIKKG